MKKKKCIILLPTCYNDGKEVPTEVLTRMTREIDEVFDGHHIAGVGEGAYRMANGSMAYDPSLELWVAVEPKKIEVLRKMARRFAKILKQETIYFEVVNSEVEFIEPEHENEIGSD